MHAFKYSHIVMTFTFFVLGYNALDAKFCVCAFAGAVSRLPLAYMHSGIHGVNSHIFVFTNSARDAMFGVRAFRECSLSSLTFAYVQSSIARCGDIYIFVFVCSARGAMIGVYFFVVTFAFGIAHLFSLGVTWG